MSIIRTHKQRSFAVIDHEPIDDSRLSWEALGLLTYLLSKPDNWTVNADHLVEMARGAGRDKVYRILKEMEDAGYLVRRREHKADGTFQWVRELYESPNIAAATADDDNKVTASPVSAFLAGELAQVPVLSDLFGSADAPQPLTGLPYMAEPYTAEPDTAKPDSIINTESIKIIIDLDASPVGKRLSPAIRQAFEQRCGLIASPLLEERIIAAEGEYPQEWILRAIELAGSAGPGKNNWQYVSGILANWKREGLAAQSKTASPHNGSGPPRKAGRSPLVQNDPNASGVTYTVIEL